MPDDLLATLTRFHREIVLPDVERIVNDAIGRKVDGLRDEMNSHFDAIYKRLECLEAEYHALSAAVARLEQRMDAVERALRRLDVREELETLKAQIADLQQRVADIETELSHGEND